MAAGYTTEESRKRREQALVEMKTRWRGGRHFKNAKEKARRAKISELAKIHHKLINLRVGDSFSWLPSDAERIKEMASKLGIVVTIKCNDIKMSVTRISRKKV